MNQKTWVTVATFRKIVQTRDLVQHILDSISRSIEGPIGLGLRLQTLPDCQELGPGTRARNQHDH